MKITYLIDRDSLGGGMFPAADVHAHAYNPSRVITGEDDVHSRAGEGRYFGIGGAKP